jgi:hypothetical protein
MKFRLPFLLWSWGHINITEELVLKGKDSASWTACTISIAQNTANICKYKTGIIHNSKE